MKANEFVKKYGLDLVNLDVACLESGFIAKADFLEHYGFEILDDLKRLVESHELVSRFHGLDKAKRELQLIEDGSIFRCCIAITAKSLKQAIADVESFL